jgi:hypothetical protein
MKVKRVQYTDQLSDAVYEFRFDEELGYLEWRIKHSDKSDERLLLPNKLTWEEMSRIEFLRHYIRTEMNLLVYRSNNSIKPIGMPQLASLFKLSDQHTKIFVKKLKEQGVIKEAKINDTEYYIVNPIFILGIDDFFTAQKNFLNEYKRSMKKIKEQGDEWS